jgi:hypothetical protein
MSKEHTHSAIKFKLFGKQNIVNAIDSGHKEYTGSLQSMATVKYLKNGCLEILEISYGVKSI